MRLPGWPARPECQFVQSARQLPKEFQRFLCYHEPVTSANSARVYSAPVGYTRAKRSCQRPSWNTFTGNWLRRWRWLIGALAAYSGGVLQAQEPAVRTLPLGLFTVYAATEPFRLSWFYRDELLLADRYRRHDSAIEALDQGGWRPLGRLLEARAERGESLGESRWRLRIGGAGPQEFIVLLLNPILLESLHIFNFSNRRCLITQY